VAVASEQVTQVKLRRVAEAFGGQSEVARLLGVHRSRISRWLAGEEPDPRNKARLEALEFILARLLQTFAVSTARKWLSATNAHLGNRRPLELIARNRLAEVIAAIEQADLDSYA
jgi:transcriptional regulator with XRE-family HTH domain